MYSGSAQPMVVLIVEDDPIDRQQLSTVLSSDPHLHNLQIHWTNTVEATLKRLEQDHFDALLLDLNLPDSSGIDTLRSVCSKAPDLPVIVITGLDDEDWARFVLAQGAQDYLNKDSYHPRELERALYHAIERKLVEKQLRESKIHLEKAVEARTHELLQTTRMLSRVRENLSKLIRHNVDAILVVDSLGIVRFANPAALKLFERPADLLVGEEFGFAVVANQKADIEIVHNEKRVVWAEMRAVTIDWEGEPASLVTVRDVTENKKAEEELARVLALKSEFISMASHELRTPLAAITQSIWLVVTDQGGVLTDEQKEFLGIAKSNTDRLARLINDLLDFQKLDQHKMRMDIRMEHINTTVADVCRTMLPIAAEKDVELETSLTLELPEIPFDADRITQVLTNLVQNAIKFTDEGRIEVRTELKNEQVRVSVSDTGLGVPEAEADRLFTAFGQLQTGGDRKTGGTGLGLAISRKIIEAHHGVIWAEPNPVKGTVFHFTLPLQRNSRKGELQHVKENIGC